MKTKRIFFFFLGKEKEKELLGSLAASPSKDQATMDQKG